MDFLFEENRICLKDESGEVIAEIDFSKKNESTISIDRTFVDPSIEGQGIAGIMMETLALKLRADRKKASPSCAYAISWFEKNPDYSDLLS